MENDTNSIIIIQKWWRLNTYIIKLRNIYNYLYLNLNNFDLQEISNNCKSLTQISSKEGKGLISGTLIDLFITKFFQEKLLKYEDDHNGESDMIICGLNLSQKKINGKSTIASDWSKNEIKCEKKYFTCDILIINLKSEQWWKKNPKKNIDINLNIIYTDTIPAGLYIINKTFCKYYIELDKNNKTNSLIKEQYLYIMLKHSLFQKLFIPLPEPNKDINFNILKTFSK